jgi:regulator of cell morphogenesis and NO signaling
MDHDGETAVTDWVIDHPQTLGIFQELGIDYSCGGKSLGFACQEQGINVETVVQRIRKTIESNDPIG